MKSTIILPPPGNFQREDIYMRRRWRRVQYLANLFWSRWRKEYLVTLQNRQKWINQRRNIAIGDIVIIKEENQPRGSWSMGRVIVTEPDKEGFIRSVTVKTSTTEIRRPIHELVVLLKGQCQLQCIARSNNAWRPFYWQSNSCFGFQSVIYFNHPMVILAHFNRIVTTKHQRNVYNRYLLTFHHFQGKM
jgi:hypothetical protein